jgi:hypothetical protein
MGLLLERLKYQLTSIDTLKVDIPWATIYGSCVDNHYRLCLAGVISLPCHHSQLLKKNILYLEINVFRKIMLLSCSLVQLPVMVINARKGELRSVLIQNRSVAVRDLKAMMRLLYHQHLVNILS